MWSSIYVVEFFRQWMCMGKWQKPCKRQERVNILTRWAKVSNIHWLWCQLSQSDTYIYTTMAGCCHFSLNLKSCFCKIQGISNWNTESKELYQKISRFGSFEKEHLNKINCFKKYNSSQFRINWQSTKSYKWRLISGSLGDVNFS